MVPAMRSPIIACCLLLAVSPVAAVDQSPPVSASCASAPARSLDFWVGTWDVTNPAGALVAESVVESIAAGCAVLEKYTGRPRPNGARYIGAGLHVFDHTTGKWRQLFSDVRPAITQMDGRIAEGSVVYEWTVEESPGKPTPKRYTLSPFQGGVRQLGERSDDGGKTWSTEFDLRYRLKSPGRSGQ